MGRFLDSLVLRIGLTFLSGLLALQVSIAVIVLWPDGRPAVFRLASPEDAADMALALETAEPRHRPLLVAALNTSGQIVQLEPSFPMAEPAEGLERPAKWVKRAFERYGDALSGRPFVVQTRPARAMSTLLGGEVGAPGSIRLLVRLRTGDTLIIERAPVLLQRLFGRLLAIGLVITAILAAVMALCMIQMARPIDRLARGARRFATDVGAPDIAPHGAREIKDLAQALNHMKLQIRTLLEERTRVLAAIAHDLRTYLTRLRLRAEFIDDVKQRERAVTDLDEMSLLLEDTLTFAQEARSDRSEEREGVDLAAEIAAFVTARREMGQLVEAVDCVDRPFVTVCRRLAIRRILANLVDNALRYGGGARLSLSATDREAALTVDDDGPGAPDDALSQLVEPFHRLEPSRGRQTGGAGLGLAIVKALAESQGGRLVLENRAVGGLRATIYLPLIPVDTSRTS